MPAVIGSASVRDKQATVTLTNPSVDAPAAVRLAFADGASASSARGTVLTHEDMRARNTFEKPDEVKLALMPVQVERGAVSLQLPKQSVAAIEIDLA